MLENEKRTSFVKREIHTTVVDGKKLTIRGYPIVFDVETRVFDWQDGAYVTEVIRSTALDNTDLSNVMLLVGHNPDNILGRSNKNMRLEVDDIGLFFECELPNTQYARDWYNLVEDGIVDSMSFSFRTDDPIDYSTMTRTITNLLEVREITITPFPAYKEASVVAKRTQSEIELKEREEQAEKLAKQEREAEEVNREERMKLIGGL